MELVASDFEVNPPTMFKKSRTVRSTIIKIMSFPCAFIPSKGGMGRRFIRRLQMIQTGGSHSDRRWRAIGLMAVASIGERIIISVCSLVQVPIALNYLGTEGFGLWMTLTNLTSFMSVADLGLGAGMQNKLSEAYGRDDMEEARLWFVSGTALLAFIGLCMLSIALPLCFVIPWGDIFRIQHEGMRAAAGPALAILVTGFLFGFPLAATQRLTYAFQMGWMTSVKNIVTGVFTLSAIAAAVSLKLSFLSFMLMGVVPPIIGNLILLIVILRRLDWPLTSFGKCESRAATQLLRQNWLFILPTIGATVLGLVPALMISGILGAAAITPYNLTQRLLGLFALIQTMLLGPLWPAYTEAKARGDVVWIAATYKKSLWLTFVFSVIPTLSFSLWGRWALHLWSKKPVASFDPWLIFLLCVWTAVTSYSQTVALLLNALQKIKGQATYGIVSVGIAVATMPFCIRRWGVAGDPLSLILSFALIALPFVCWEGNAQIKAMTKPSNAN